MKRNTNSLSRRVGTKHVTATPKAKQNFESQTRAKQFLYSRHVAAPTQPLHCNRTHRLRSAGRPTPQIQVVSSKAEVRVCPLTTKKSQRKLVMSTPLSLSLFLFSQSSGDSPGAESSRRNQFISA
jgi:hypothetical protein